MPPVTSKVDPVLELCDHRKLTKFRSSFLKLKELEKSYFCFFEISYYVLQSFGRYLIILCCELLWSKLCSSSVYFLNLILILISLYHPGPVCSLERSLEHGFSSILDYSVLKSAPVQSILRILFWPGLGLKSSK